MLTFFYFFKAFLIRNNTLGVLLFYPKVFLHFTMIIEINRKRIVLSFGGKNFFGTRDKYIPKAIMLPVIIIRIQILCIGSYFNINAVAYNL